MDGSGGGAPEEDEQGGLLPTEFDDRISRMAVDQAPIGIALVAPDGSFLRVNRELCRMLGLDEAELLSGTFQDITHPDDLDADLALLGSVIAGDLAGYRMEKRYLRPDGSIVWAQLDVAAVREDGVPLYLISQLQDIGFRKDAEARLSQLALHDALTDLPNRLLLRDRLTQAIGRSTRTGKSLAVVFIDLDDFKLVNDTRGHGIGDQLLLRVARRLERALRPGDTLARFGGDEFVALLDNVEDEAMAARVAERLVEAMRLPFEMDDEQFSVSASFGLVLTGGDAGIDDLLRHADLAMYEAKRRGKNRLTVFDQDLEQVAVARVETERNLRRAIEQGELFPAYQPVVDLATGQIVAFEMLARWRRPGSGVIVANDFIAVADAAGLMPDLTSALLEQVETDLEALGIAAGRRLLVNMTPGVLAAPGIAARLHGLADAVGDHSLLVIEMTESHLMQLDGSAAELLKQLRATGVQFSVDDFGTGFSALSRLTSLEPDVIKIDRVFVQDLDSLFARVLVSGLAQICRELGIRTIAEGVERVEQREALLELGCPLAQGYLLGRPVPIEDIRAP